MFLYSTIYSREVSCIDDQAYAWPLSVFTPKQVSGPRTAKSQPIWIKFCAHLLLYGIDLWADLDRNRRVGGSRPTQKDYFFSVTLVTHTKYYIETTDRHDFGGKASEWR